GGGRDDVLRGGGDDLLVGGTTAYDSDQISLALLRLELIRTDADYLTRIDHLSGSSPGGLNGNAVLNAQTVHEDGAADDLWGEAGQDWFVLAGGANPDRANDPETGEIATTL